MAGRIEIIATGVRFNRIAGRARSVRRSPSSAPRGIEIDPELAAKLELD